MKSAIPSAHLSFLIFCNRAQKGRVAGGFTMMEVIVSLGALALLMSGVLAIANGSMDLANDMSVMQDRSSIRQNFVEFMRRSFRTLPAESEVRLMNRQQGGNYLPTLNFVNGGSSFALGSPLPPDTSVDLYAEKMASGYLRVMLRVLDIKQTQALRSNQSVRYTRDQFTMPLLENVSRFEWRLFDAATNRWENNWKQVRRPILAEMRLQLDDGFETKSVFWLPPVIPNAVGGAPAGMPQLPGVPGGPGTPGTPGTPGLPNSPNAPGVNLPPAAPPPSGP